MSSFHGLNPLLQLEKYVVERNYGLVSLLSRCDLSFKGEISYSQWNIT